MLIQVSNAEIQQYFRHFRESSKDCANNNLLMSIGLRFFVFLFRVKQENRVHALLEYLAYIREHIEYFRQYRNLMIVVHQYWQELEKLAEFVHEEQLKQDVEEMVLDWDVIFSMMHRYC